MENKDKLPFGKRNYQWMVIGIVALILGFVVMSLDPKQHGFGILGLTLGPIIIVAGFVIEIYAIITRPEDKK